LVRQSSYLLLEVEDRLLLVNLRHLTGGIDPAISIMVAVGIAIRVARAPTPLIFGPIQISICSRSTPEAYNIVGRCGTAGDIVQHNANALGAIDDRGLHSHVVLTVPDVVISVVGGTDDSNNK
jgi:hypothetical protein